MNMKKLLVLLMLLLFCFTIAACGGGQTETEKPIPKEEIDDGINREVIIDNIVSGGASQYKVVYGAQASQAEIFAAGELVNYISSCTGVSLALSLDTAVTYDPNGRFISVGKTALLKNSGIAVEYDKLNADGFVIRTGGKNMYIAGASDRGTIYGVYDFLEKVAGIKFIAEDVTHIPQTNTLPLYEMNVEEAPAFAYRNLYSYSMRIDDLLYTRLRFNAPERAISDMYGGRTDWYTELKGITGNYTNLKAMYPHYPDFNVIHNAYYWVSPADYYAEHPEFFAADAKGNTIRDSAGTICQLNLLNGITDSGELDETMDISVAKAALQSLKNFILDDPEAEIFFFGHNDWPVYDLTERSVKAAEQYGGQSGILMRFVNVLSKEINKWLDGQNMDREVKIATWAYLHTKEAPVVSDGKGGWKAAHESIIPADDVIIRIAPIELDWYYSVTDSNQIEEFGNLVTQWTYLTNNFMIWTYETNFGNYLFYYPSMRQWTENIRYFNDIGVKYLFMQDNYHGHGSWQAELHTYVAAKMMWNPALKIQPLIDEFLYYYFGESGAASVGQMMDMFDDHFAILQAESEGFWMPFRDDDGTTLFNAEYFPIELLEKAEKLMKEAIAANAADKDITDRDRNSRDRKLTSALLTPQAMIIKNYSVYYNTGRAAYAAEFVKNAEYVGVKDLSEILSLINYKYELGVT